MLGVGPVREISVHPDPDHVAQLTEDEGGRHGKAGAAHIAHHDAQLQPARFSATIASPSVRPPHLSSLMFTTSKRPTGAGKVGEAKQRFRRPQSGIFE